MSYAHKPADEPGECNAHLYLGDDHGDNERTIRCFLKKGHAEGHECLFHRDKGEVRIQWDVDERVDQTREPDEAKRCGEVYKDPDADHADRLGLTCERAKGHPGNHRVWGGPDWMRHSWGEFCYRENCDEPVGPDSDPNKTEYQTCEKHNFWSGDDE